MVATRWNAGCALLALAWSVRADDTVPADDTDPIPLIDPSQPWVYSPIPLEFDSVPVPPALSENPDTATCRVPVDPALELSGPARRFEGRTFVPLHELYSREEPRLPNPAEAVRSKVVDVSLSAGELRIPVTSRVGTVVLRFEGYQPTLFLYDWYHSGWRCVHWKRSVDEFEALMDKLLAEEASKRPSPD